MKWEKDNLGERSDNDNKKDRQHPRQLTSQIQVVPDDSEKGDEDDQAGQKRKFKIEPRTKKKKKKLATGSADMIDSSNMSIDNVDDMESQIDHLATTLGLSLF